MFLLRILTDHTREQTGCELLTLRLILLSDLATVEHKFCQELQNDS